MLNESTLELLPFFEMTPDLVCIADKEGYFKKINKATIEKLGYTEEELLATPVFSFMHPDDRERTGAQRQLLLNGSPMINFQNRYIKKSGEIIWLDWTAVYFPDKELVFAIAKDVTDRRRMEQQLQAKYEQYRSLASHFKTSLEKDMKNLSVELQEDLAQLAAVIKIDLQWVLRWESDLPSSVVEQLTHAAQALDKMMVTIRRMSFSLSPSMIHDIGFYETLQWYCSEFSVLNNIPCKLTGNTAGKTLSKEIKLDLFRVVQDALNNIAQHSGATSAIVELNEEENQFVLHIRDDGKGFMIDAVPDEAGIKNMKERVISFGGSFYITSGNGYGTTIRVMIPK
ncbi:PAS domain S-box protein [Lacibacter sp. MH-610]|uniref:PAS domain-containing sensor histidine kinase n=1 Tax=Lacibacter sp. MH-610 TaxID=3020883 RepID=UPI003891B5D2